MTIQRRCDLSSHLDVYGPPLTPLEWAKVELPVANQPSLIKATNAQLYNHFRPKLEEKDLPLTRKFGATSSATATERVHMMSCLRYMRSTTLNMLTRLQWCILPTGSNFGWQGEAASWCPMPECQRDGVVENLYHLSFQCPRIWSIWRRAWELIRPFRWDVPISFVSVILPSSLIVQPRYKSMEQVVKLFWSLLVSLVLGQHWHSRNAVLFESMEPKETESQWRSIVGSACSHLRVWRFGKHAKFKDIDTLGRFLTFLGDSNNTEFGSHRLRLRPDPRTNQVQNEVLSSRIASVDT